MLHYPIYAYASQQRVGQQQLDNKICGGIWTMCTQVNHFTFLATGKLCTGLWGLLDLLLLVLVHLLLRPLMLLLPQVELLALLLAACSAIV